MTGLSCLLQAAVMEALGLGDSASLLHPEQLAQGLIRAFAQYVQTQRIHPCKTSPNHGPELYLQIWTCIEDLGEKGYPEDFEEVQYGNGLHPGLVDQVPRKRRSGASNCLQVCTTLSAGIAHFNVPHAKMILLQRFAFSHYSLFGRLQS
jgi:hypothetical protein